MSNKGHKLITFNVKPSMYIQIENAADRRHLSVAGFIALALREQFGIHDATRRYTRHKDGTPRTTTHLREQSVYFCPFCKGPMEITERRDKIDIYGANHYHSQDIQLECSPCKTGHCIVLNLPYRD